MQARMSQMIYKILRPAEYREARANALYRGSADDVRDGFIHFSTDEQLKGTLDKHYQNAPEVHLLSFNVKKFSTKTLRWETSRGGALFPHLYETLDVQQAEQHWCIDPTQFKNIQTLAQEKGHTHD